MGSVEWDGGWTELQKGGRLVGGGSEREKEKSGVMGLLWWSLASVEMGSGLVCEGLRGKELEAVEGGEWKGRGKRGVCWGSGWSAMG